MQIAHYVACPTWSSYLGPPICMVKDRVPVCCCSSEWWVLSCMPTALLPHNIPQLYVWSVIVCSALVDPVQQGAGALTWHWQWKHEMTQQHFWIKMLNWNLTPFLVFWLKLVKFWRNTVVLWKWVLIPWSSWKANVSCKDSYLMEIKLLLRVHMWILYKFSTEGWKC